MKIIKIFLLSLIALCLIAGTGIFILFQTFDTGEYLGQIINKASVVLGRSVSIGGLGLGLSSQGITLDAGPVTVADDADFTTQPFIEIEKVSVSLDLTSLILHREIRIKNILLQSPQIHFIRNLEGNINIRSIGQASQSTYSHPDRPQFMAQKDIKAPIDSSPVGLRMAKEDNSPIFYKEGLGEFSPTIIIKDAAISYIDQNQTCPLDIWLEGINASINSFSLSKPFQASFDASLYSNTPNVHASSNVSLSFSNVSSSFPNALIGNPGISLSDLKFNTDFSQLDTDRLQGISPDFADDPILKNIAGVLQLNLARLETDASGNIVANGDVAVTGGVIRNFNIIKELLSRTLGAFEGDIDNLLNGQLKDKLEAKDTVIQKAQAQFSVHDKALFIDNSLIQTNILELSANGSMDQGLNLDMQTLLHLNADVSAAFINQIEALKYLCDDSGRIAIDASLKGDIHHLKYKPNKDFKKRMKKSFKSIFGGFF